MTSSMSSCICYVVIVLTFSIFDIVITGSCHVVMCKIISSAQHSHLDRFSPNAG